VALVVERHERLLGGGSAGQVVGGGSGHAGEGERPRWSPDVVQVLVHVTCDTKQSQMSTFRSPPSSFCVATRNFICGAAEPLS
jgi:hypothetical protein